MTEVECSAGPVKSWGLSVAVRVVVVFALLSYTLAQAAQGDSEFTAEGSVDFHNFLSTNPAKPSVRFSIVVSNSCWIMRITPSVNPGDRYQEAAFDGQTLYHMIAMHVPPVAGASQSPLSGKNVATAWIYDNQRVVYDIFGHQMGAVWLMYASGGYLKGARTGDLIVPAVTFGLFEIEHYHERPFKQRAKWTLQTAFPYLPLEVTYLDDGEVKTSPQFEPYRRKPPFDAGFTNVVFKVNSVTNCDGVLVPLSADLDTFRPSLSGEPKLVHYTQYHISLQAWSRSIRPVVFRPRLFGLTVISDARVFERAGNVSYLAQTNWPQLEEVTNRASFERTAQVVQAGRSNRAKGEHVTSTRLWLARSVIAVLVVLPVAVFGTKRYKERTIEKGAKS